jgi:hypothetical protein
MFYLLATEIHNATIEGFEIMPINRRRHLHEVLEIVRRCDDSISATYIWTSVGKFNS